MQLFAIEMLVAISLVHYNKGLDVKEGGMELVLLLFAITVSLMITGPGRRSLDKRFSRREKTFEM